MLLFFFFYFSNTFLFSTVFANIMLFFCNIFIDRFREKHYSNNNLIDEIKPE